MAAFKKKFNPDKVLFVDNSGLSWQEFLKMKPMDLFDSMKCFFEHNYAGGTMMLILFFYLLIKKLYV
jgi:hypothetical protein